MLVQALNHLASNLSDLIASLLPACPRTSSAFLQSNSYTLGFIQAGRQEGAFSTPGEDSDISFLVCQTGAGCQIVAMKTVLSRPSTQMTTFDQLKDPDVEGFLEMSAHGFLLT